MFELFFQAQFLVFLGVIAGLLSCFAFVPYIRDTLASRTRPQRASWLIWAVLGSIAFFSQVYEGAGASLWFVGIQVSGTLTVLMLSIWKGKGTYFRYTDILVLTAAACGLVLWYFSQTAIYALATTITISLLGGVVTVIKAYREPSSETRSMWFLSFFASIFAALSVGQGDLILLAYPMYLFTLYGAILVALALGQERHRDLSMRAMHV